MKFEHIQKEFEQTAYYYPWVGSKEDGILGVFRAILAMIEVEKRCWKKPLYLLETIKFVNKTSLNVCFVRVRILGEEF